jgi:hypothetical protein
LQIAKNTETISEYGWPGREEVKMENLNAAIQEYTLQLKKGHIQKAYSRIMTFLSELKASLEHSHADYSFGALYFGYMDMSYFAFAPAYLKNRNLKIAIVFLHETCTFEAWLIGRNRQIQADYIERLSHTDLRGFTLSQMQSGVDSIIASQLVEKPDFDNSDELKRQIDLTSSKFVQEIIAILESAKT